MRKIKIKVASIEAIAEIYDTKTADAIWEALPITSKVNTWGEEIYFPIPVKMDEEDAKSVVNIGDIAYWPEGHCFCIFFGPTPISKKDKIIPASPVNVFGKILGDAKIFKNIKDDEKIIVERR